MNTFRYRIRRYRGQILLVLSVFIIPLLTNLFSAWLEKTFGETPARLAQLVAIGVAAAVALGVLYWALGQERREQVLVPQELQPPQFPGLIILVGPGRRGEDPLQGSGGPAIEYHLGKQEEGEPPSLCLWMIASEEGIPVAENLRSQYQDRCKKIEIVPIGRAFDIRETYRAVREIYLQKAKDKGLSPDQVIADFTGGTKMMSAGMVLACGDRWPMQYMSGMPGAQPLPILVRFQPEDEGG
jgi:hypothetical protein